MNFVDSVFRSKLLTYKDHVFKDMIRGRDEVLGSPKHENVEVVMRMFKVMRLNMKSVGFGLPSKS